MLFDIAPLGVESDYSENQLYKKNISSEETGGLAAGFNKRPI